MRTVREIEDALYEMAPRELAFGWDNVGQLLGDPNQQVEKVLVALDITEAVADEAIEKGCQLIVAHHPVMNCIWLPVQTVRTDTPQGHLLLKLLLNNVGAICMHTNLDAADGGVNDCLANALQLENPGPLGREEEKLCWMGSLKEPMQLEEFVKFVSGALGCNGVRYAGTGNEVRRVAVGGGSCGNSQGAVIAAGCDTFVTADLGYHDFLDAAGKGLNLIDAGHFPTEDVVCKEVISYLIARFPELSVEKSTSHKEVIQYYVEGDL